MGSSGEQRENVLLLSPLFPFFLNIILNVNWGLLKNVELQYNELAKKFFKLKDELLWFILETDNPYGCYVTAIYKYDLDWNF